MMREINPGRTRWERYAEEGTCHYCDAEGPVRPDPFAQEESCFTCWEALAYGDDE